MSNNDSPVVGVIMGSQSDWPTLEKSTLTLTEFGIPWEAKVVSAHRTPDLLYEYARSAESRGLKCIIAGAGGAAHLPGMTASIFPIPVLGVPVNQGLSAGGFILSIVQMPAGVSTATFAVGEAGATNAALFAVSMLAANGDDDLRKLEFRTQQKESRSKRAPARYIIP